MLAALRRGGAPATSPAARDLCLGGLAYASDGFRACALDEAAPCAVKALQGSVTMEQCTALCDVSCAALSLYLGQECWIYASLSGAAVDVAGSIFCVRPGPPPPPAPTARAEPPTLAEAEASETADLDALPPLFAGLAVGDASGLPSAMVAAFLRLPPAVLVAVAVGMCLGVVFLVVGCVLLVRPRRRAACDASAGGTVSDAACSNDEHSKRQAGRGVHRVLIEAGGGVSTVRVVTGGCKSVSQLRRVVAAACEHLSGGAAEEAMHLEYLDEEAGLAITVCTRPCPAPSRRPVVRRLSVHSG